MYIIKNFAYEDFKGKNLEEAKQDMFDCIEEFETIEGIEVDGVELSESEVEKISTQLQQEFWEWEKYIELDAIGYQKAGDEALAIYGGRL